MLRPIKNVLNYRILATDGEIGSVSDLIVDDREMKLRYLVIDTEDLRSQKRSKFGGIKYVYPRPVMAELRRWFAAALPERLPGATLLYWT